MLRKIVSEPLLHFIVLSVLIFVVYEVLNPRQDDQQTVTVSEGRVSQISNSFLERWGRAPSSKELDGAIHVYAVNEMFIREAKGLGLDVDDQAIDQRLRKKMNYLLEDLADANRPTDDVLQQFYADNAAKYLSPTRYSLQQVLLSIDRSDDALTELVVVQKQRIQQGLAPEGDNSMLPSDVKLMPTDQLARRFGTAFVEGLDKVEIQQWSGPVASAFGEHFVFVTVKQNAKAQPFETVKADVLSDWQYENNKTFQQDYEERLLERYTIVVEGTETKGPETPALDTKTLENEALENEALENEALENEALETEALETKVLETKVP